MSVNIQLLRDAMRAAVANPHTSALDTDAENRLTALFNACAVDAEKAVKGVLKLRISQAGTAAPTIGATYRNTLVGSPAPVLARTGVGIYTLNIGAGITALKNKIFMQASNGAGAGSITMQVIAGDLIQITTYNAAGAATDAILTDAQIEIEQFV